MRACVCMCVCVCPPNIFTGQTVDVCSFMQQNFEMKCTFQFLKKISLIAKYTVDFLTAKV